MDNPGLQLKNVTPPAEMVACVMHASFLRRFHLQSWPLVIEESESGIRATSVTPDGREISFDEPRPVIGFVERLRNLLDEVKPLRPAP
jgi:hypothetical protein